MNSLFPVIVTKDLKLVQDFYQQYFDFKIVFKADWYVQLHYERERLPPLELAFMLPEMEGQPAEVQGAFSGLGLILTLDYEDVDRMAERISEANPAVDLVLGIRDEPWGQRHFMFRDPIGMMVDVVKNIPVAAEYENAVVKQ